MRIRFNYKIFTIVIISLAFVLRLLSVNICALTSFKSSQTNKRTASHTSTLKKRRRDADHNVKSNVEIYSAVEVCEESSDTEENVAKAHWPVLFFFLFFLFKRTETALESNALFDSGDYHLHPKRYLALSALRI